MPASGELELDVRSVQLKVHEFIANMPSTIGKPKLMNNAELKDKSHSLGCCDP